MWTAGKATITKSSKPGRMHEELPEGPPPSYGQVHEQLQQRLDELKYKATKHHFAIAIAHPYPETIDFLRQALPELTEQGFELVPVSQLVHKKYIQLAQAQGKGINAR